MTRKNLGYILAAVGLALVAAGVFGLVFKQQPVLPPVAQPTESTGPSTALSVNLPPELSYFTGTYENPEIASYSAENSNLPAEGVPDFHNVIRIMAHGTDNPNTGAPSDALLMTLPAVPDSEFTVTVLVESEKPPMPGLPKELYGLQWQLAYSDGKFIKSAQYVGADGADVKPSDHFNTRYQGFGDRAEVEFYGPPGTRYYAILLANGEYYSFIQPKTLAQP